MIDDCINAKAYEPENKADRDRNTRELRLMHRNEWMEQQKDHAGKKLLAKYL
jgi:hypothetical protein